MTMDEAKALLDLLKPMRLDLARECNDLKVSPDDALIRLNRIQDVELWIIERLRATPKA